MIQEKRWTEALDTHDSEEKRWKEALDTHDSEDSSTPVRWIMDRVREIVGVPRSGLPRSGRRVRAVPRSVAKAYLVSCASCGSPWSGR